MSGGVLFSLCPLDPPKKRGLRWHSTFKGYVFGAEGYYEQKIVQGGANCKGDLSWCSRFRLKEPVYPFEQAWGMRSLLDSPFPARPIHRLALANISDLPLWLLFDHDQLTYRLKYDLKLSVVFLFELVQFAR